MSRGYETSSTPGDSPSGVLLCIGCNAPRDPGYRLCAQCRRAKERRDRRARREENAGKLCSVEGCQNSRHQMRSQTSPYCLEHRREKTKQSKRARSHHEGEERHCERPECGAPFVWFPTAPNASRYCSNECRLTHTQALLAAGTAWCGSCSQYLPVANFSHAQLRRSSKSCKGCISERMGRYKMNLDPDRLAARRATYVRVSRKNRFKQYGITPEEFDALVEAQGGRCLICDEKAGLVPDHCHTEGRYRGAICGECNKGLGCFKDSPEALETAAQYLRSWKEVDGRWTG